MESMSNGTSPVLLLIADALSRAIAVVMRRWRVEKISQQDTDVALTHVQNAYLQNKV